MNELDTDHTANEAAGAAGRPLSLSDRVRSLQLPDRPSGHARGSAWLPWTLCALLAVAAGYAGVVASQGDKEYQEYVELKKTVGNPVEMLANQAKTQAQENKAKRNDPALGAIVLEAKGYIIPISLIQVSPKVGGMVMELNITEGMRVKKDFLLAKLEDIDYKAELDRAQATAEGAERRFHELSKYREQEIEQVAADLADGEAQLDQLTKDYKRSEVLKASDALPVKEYEQAESAFKSAKYRTVRLKLAYDLLVKGPRDEKIAACKADWDQAQADLDKAKWRFANTKVLAPTNGIILSKKAEQFNMVNPSAFSNGLSASLCEMADLTKMEVDLAIAERDIGKVFDQQECVVRAEAFPDRSYVGWVTRRMPTADRSKGAVPVRVQIRIPAEEEGQYLRPEMGAVVTFFNKTIDPEKKK